jgi:hypothetical protein
MVLPDLVFYRRVTRFWSTFEEVDDPDMRLE